MPFIYNWGEPHTGQWSKCMLERHIVSGEWTKKSDRKAIQVLYMLERHVEHVMWTIYQIFDQQSIRSSAHITRDSIMASDVRREANKDRLKRRRERDRNRRVQPVYIASYITTYFLICGVAKKVHVVCH